MYNEIENQDVQFELSLENGIIDLEIEELEERIALNDGPSCCCWLHLLK